MNYSGNSLSFVLRLFFLSFFLICVPAFGDDGAESVNARGSFEERYGSYGDFYSPEDSENLSHVYYEYGTPATKWTVLVYMSGSKMESSYGEGSGVLLKMASSCANPNVRILAQTGGSSRWRGGKISSKKLQRYRLSNGRLELVSEHPSDSMGKAETLSSFIKWGRENYPADRYMILFWGEGSSVSSGFMHDEIYQDDFLSVLELKDAFSEGGTHFDIAAFDSSLSQSLELCRAISPYAHYSVASEETMLPFGFDYESWVSYLSKNCSCAVQSLCKKIADSYFDFSSESLFEECTVSVVDLTRIGPLYRSFVKMSDEMQDASSTIVGVKMLSLAARNSLAFGIYGKLDRSNMLDLGDFANLAGFALSDSTYELLSNLDDAVIYERHGAKREDATGLSFFYPLDSSSDELDSYASFSENGAYLAYIDAISDYWRAPPWVYGFFPPSKNQVPSLSESVPVRSRDFPVRLDESETAWGEPLLILTSGSESISSVDFGLLFMESSSGRILNVGFREASSIDEIGIRYGDALSLSCMSMDSNVMNCIYMEENFDSLDFSVPVLLNGRRTNLLFSQNPDGEGYSLSGAFDSMSFRSPMPRKRNLLRTGDMLEFIFTDIESFAEIPMGYTTFGSSNKISFRNLPDGNYMGYYVVTDVFGNTYESLGRVFRISSGVILPAQFMSE